MAYYTHLGDGPVSLAVIAFVCWNVDRGLGLRLGLLLMTGGALNGLLKLYFAAPRPAWFLAQPAPHQLWHSFGMPSGHAQSATIWLLAAHHWRSRLMLAIALCYALSMGASRVVIGAHSWPQVCAGWGGGVGLVFVFVWCEAQLRARLKSPQWMTPRLDLTLSLLLTGVVSATVLAASAIVQSTAPEHIEVQVSFSQKHGLSLPSPASLRGVVPPLGALVGLLVGARLDCRHSPLAPPSRGGMLRRAVIGFGVLGVVYAGLKLGLPLGGEAATVHVLRGLSALALGVLITAGVPAVIRRVEQPTGH